MIDLNLMYLLYIEELKVKIRDLKTLKNKSLEDRKNYSNILNKYAEFFTKYTNTTINKVLSLKTTTELEEIILPTEDILFNGKTVRIEALKLYLEHYRIYNNKVIKYTSLIKSTESKIVSEKVYRTIIQTFNNLEVDNLINHNHYFKFNTRFGAISIVQNTIKNPTVNWGASLKKKKELLDQGLIPYYKADEEKAIEEGKEYNGIEWLIKFPKLDFYLHWYKNKKMKQFIPLIKDYAYIPTRGKNSIVDRLKVVKENPEQSAIKYTRTPKKSLDYGLQTSI